MKIFKSIFAFLWLISWVFLIGFYTTLTFSFIFDNNHFIVILIGIFTIIFGYWHKDKIYSYNRASPYTVEFIESLIKKRELNEKLTFNDKVTLFVEDGYGVKICNILGLILIFIGIVLYIYTKIFN